MNEIKKRIMLVDDDPDITAMLKLLLQVSGYDVRTLYNPAQAMLALHAEKPDLIVVDVMMPNHSGFELCRYIRREPALTKIPIVIYSALGDAATIRTGLEAGADAYLEKTASKQQLLEVISTALAKAVS